MAYTLFISEERLKETTAIADNVEISVLLPYIKTAQRKFIETALGTDLHNALQNKITNSNLSGNYTTLLNDYVSDCLAHYSFYEALPYIHYKIHNKGIVAKSSDNASPVGRAELQDLRNDILNTAQWYENRLIEYLKHNTGLFPEYSTNTNEDISPSRTVYSGAMNLDKDIQGYRYKRRNITLNDFLTTDLTY